MTHSDDCPTPQPPAGKTLCLKDSPIPAPSLIASFGQAHHLTPREQQILEMICRGMKNSYIGQRLRVSDGTVRLHMGNLHRKLKTTSKVGLVLKLWKWSLQSKATPPAMAI